MKISIKDLKKMVQESIEAVMQQEVDRGDHAWHQSIKNDQQVVTSKQSAKMSAMATKKTLMQLSELVDSLESQGNDKFLKAMHTTLANFVNKVVDAMKAAKSGA